jgi:hypothetical protein
MITNNGLGGKEEAMRHERRIARLADDGKGIDIIRNGSLSKYEISLADISSAGKVLDWYFHLSEKHAMTAESLHEFMQAVEKLCALHFGKDPRDVFRGGEKVVWPK